ncbi:membrane protein [Ureibacillus massiliensis 4400831 = CIP 108448 = CCUG 49529]|uniref:Membrane protein n=1 Tax=Ureibacillus massiliensis 4400831 = CIP 108448 = CCUG 49529 TaxID=1211035 RepID=A0A0A3JZK7_9BACL|nr:QueT transporter family protein [Ureibacillus massiliensis]KGR92412.1 membrane protein [Ureibacillus massiliensis 4400831 = CIP 108448 = CCUG 49529]RKJ59426.1 QueT transporter family protein [Butyricicoccus sp. 1XD8-22]
MKTKFIATIGLVAALYVAITFLIAPFGFGEIQFRVSEILNHLVAFNPLYMTGVVIGVFIANLFSPLGLYDLVFGVGHSIITLAIFIFICKFVKNIWARLIINTFLFTFTMFIITIDLHLAYDIPWGLFLWTWFTCAVGEFVVLAVGAPIMYLLNKRLNFKDLIKNRG